MRSRPTAPSGSTARPSPLPWTGCTTRSSCAPSRGPPRRSGRRPCLQALVRASLDTSPAALGRSLSTAQGVVAQLGSVFWEPLQAVAALPDERQAQGREVLARLVEALQADELSVALGPALHE